MVTSIFSLEAIKGSRYIHRMGAAIYSAIGSPKADPAVGSALLCILMSARCRQYGIKPGRERGFKG